MRPILAVVDTNVLVSALISRREDAPPVEIVDAMLDGRIVPLFHADILAEYEEVLLRPKFRLNPNTVRELVDEIAQVGVEVSPQPSGEVLADMDDLIFFEVALERRQDDAYLVTGNMRHFPVRDYIVTPARMVQILRAR